MSATWDVNYDALLTALCCGTHCKSDSEHCHRRDFVSEANRVEHLLTDDSRRGWESPLRDLARQLKETASAHFAYSQVVDVMRVVDQHINALAFIEETNRKACSDAQ
jgi:hypothetical protein